MTPETPLDAVREARRLRGTVMLAVEGNDEQWCAACGAVDGSVELRVGEPPRGGVLRRRDAGGEQWLRDHGFAPVQDAWSRPEPALADEGCAATLSAALEHALGADPTRRCATSSRTPACSTAPMRHRRTLRPPTTSAPR
jgi:hypothetical protein